MAWTVPRTWVTDEVVTAAVMNTHVRDNLLETAPAKATTAGDLVYADGANSLARLALGNDAKVLIGGASAPAWSNIIGSASNNGSLTVTGSAPEFRIQDLGAGDTADFWRLLGNDELLRVARWDDSVAGNVDSMQLSMGDFILHTGANGTGVGSVTVATDTATSFALTTSGIIYLAASITTGGPAYVRGWWMVEIQRNNITSPAEVSILPRNDGANISTAMSFGGNTGIRDLLDTAADIHTYTGMFWERHTATDTSDYEIFAVCDTNTRFQANRGHLYVESMPYPT